MHADALICSHPRSGGRWLRYLLAHYLAARHRLGVAVSPESVFGVVPDHHDERTRGYPAFRFADRPGVPLAAVCHQPYSWELHRGTPIVFLARNPYDVVVSSYAYHTHEKGEYAGSLTEFVAHPRYGLPGWIHYVNSWAPVLLTHRDALLVSYRDLADDPGAVLSRVLRFLEQEPDARLVADAADKAGALRETRGIRTGQEGNFWDHLQPDQIFLIQEIVDRELSEMSFHLLESMGVAFDPVPRDDA